MPENIKLNVSDINVTWEYEGNEIKFPIGKHGGAIYSNPYKLIIIMNYYPSELKLDMNAYMPDGTFKSAISPYDKYGLMYGYLDYNSKVKSGVVVIAGYKERTDNFYDWQFEVDLNLFKITNRIAPSY